MMRFLLMVVLMTLGGSALANVEVRIEVTDAYSGDGVSKAQLHLGWKGGVTSFDGEAVFKDVSPVELRETLYIYHQDYADASFPLTHHEYHLLEETMYVRVKLLPKNEVFQVSIPIAKTAKSNNDSILLAANTIHGAKSLKLFAEDGSLQCQLVEHSSWNRFYTKMILLDELVDGYWELETTQGKTLEQVFKRDDVFQKIYVGFGDLTTPSTKQELALIDQYSDAIDAFNKRTSNLHATYIEEISELNDSIEVLNKTIEVLKYGPQPEVILPEEPEPEKEINVDIVFPPYTLAQPEMGMEPFLQGFEALFKDHPMKREGVIAFSVHVKVDGRVTINLNHICPEAEDIWPALYNYVENTVWNPAEVWVRKQNQRLIFVLNIEQK